jgi:hypothetical protein
MEKFIEFLRQVKKDGGFEYCNGSIWESCTLLKNQNLLSLYCFECDHIRLMSEPKNLEMSDITLNTVFRLNETSQWRKPLAVDSDGILIAYVDANNEGKSWETLKEGWSMSEDLITWKPCSK